MTVSRFRLAPLGAMLALVACLDDSPVAAGNPAVRASFTANVVGLQAGGTVRINVGYRKRSQDVVFLPSTPQQVTVAAGTTTVVPVTVNIGRCLADPNRASGSLPGCKLLIQLTMSDQTGTVGSSDTTDATGSPTVPGGAVNFGTVTVGPLVASVGVTPTSLSMNVGLETQLTATPKDAKGAAIPSAPVTWTIADPTVGQLSSTSGTTVTVRALKLGETTVTASAGTKKSAPVPLGVNTSSLTIRQRPAAGCVIAGQTVTLEVDSPAGPVTWVSSNPSAVTVSPTGVVTGVQPGSTATITATSGGTAGSATVCVALFQVTPTTLSIDAARSSTLLVTSSGGTVSFTSSAPNVATVDASGIIRGVNIGKATITATLTAASGTQSIPVSVTVNAASIVIKSKLTRAPLGRSVTYTAIVQDADGAPLPNASPSWSIADATIAGLSATSGDSVAIKALKLGTTTVTAAAGGVVGTAPFTATAVVPATRLEDVSGNGSSCPTYSTACTLVARAVDADGFPVAGASVTWSTSIEGCSPATSATTDDDGLTKSSNLCSAKGPGFYQQTVTLKGTVEQLTFHYALQGLVLTLQSLDPSRIATYTVTSDTPAEGLSATVTYRSGPATNYVTRLDFGKLSTPTSLVVQYPVSELPSGAYTFDVTVSTTTPDIGPAVGTLSFTTPSTTGVIQPKAQPNTQPNAQPSHSTPATTSPHKSP